jgi:tetratricopeptide (TPR) repeat protein
MAAEEDLYAALGVAETATPAEIQAAYFRKVRRHPPDRDAEGFRRIQAAYDVLRNPKTRKEYDDAGRTDPEAKTLLDAGRKLLEQDKAAEAVPLIKRALVRQPKSPVIRDLLTQALLALKQYPEAEKQAHQVLALEPDNPVYSVRIGDVLRARDHDSEALPHYRKAVLLDPTSAQNVVKLAYLLDYLDQPEDAIKLLEQSIARDGKVDFDDWVYFQCLYTLLTLRERHDALAATHLRIRAILPPEAEQRSFVAWFYYQTAMRVTKLGKFEAAVRSLEEAASIDNSLPDLAAIVARLHSSRAAVDELPRLRDDESFALGLRMTCWALGIQRLLGGGDELEKMFDKAADLLNDEIATAGWDIGPQVQRLQARYPGLAKLLNELLAKVRKLDAEVPKRFVRLTCPKCGQTGRTDKPTVQNLVAKGLSPAAAQVLLSTRGERGALELLSFTCQQCNTSFNGLSQVAAPSAPPSAAPSSPPSSSPCFVVTATYGDPQAHAVQVLRAYRDHVLAALGWGRLLIRLYRFLGPILARCIVLSPALREVSRRACERLARRIERQPAQASARLAAAPPEAAAPRESSPRTAWRSGRRCISSTSGDGRCRTPGSGRSARRARSTCRRTGTGQDAR